MNFNAEKPIYQQIVDYAYARIMENDWVQGGRLPSVRELSSQMAVNTHTVQKAYDMLESQGIIAVKRGMGYYLTDDAYNQVLAERRRRFMNVTLPEFLAEMKLLNLTFDDLTNFNKANS